MLIHASRQRSSGAFDLTSLVLSCLGEHRQQHDHPPWCDPVGDACRRRAKVEAQLAELAVELFGVRLVEQGPSRGETVHVKSDTSLLLLRQRTEPLDDLGLELDLTPGHSANAIPNEAGSQCAVSEISCDARRRAEA